LATTALKASKTPNIILTEIQMMNSTFKGVHFLVEGDDDCKFWKPRIKKNHTSIVTCEGRANLIGASGLIINMGLANIVGVYDSDFEQLFGITHHPDILSPTDENDLEVTLLASNALEAVLHEFSDEALLSGFEQAHGISAAEHLAIVSKEFGKLRIHSRLLGHNVDFDRLSPYRFVSQDDWTLDLVGLHTEYVTLAGITLAQLQADLLSSVPAAGDWGLCQGHDTMRILAQGLKKTISRKQLSEQDLAKVLRISYSLEMFQQSQMHASLKNIEGSKSITIFG